MRCCSSVLVAAIISCSPGPAATRTCPVLPARAGIRYSAGQLLDAFAPLGEARSFAIVIHGSSGNRRTHINQVLEVLEKADFAWFSVDYHGVGDLREAIRFIECPGRFNVTGKPVLIGEDAGAALALAVSGDARSVVGFGTDVRGAPKDPGVPVLLFHGDADEEYPMEPVREACAAWAHCTFKAVAGGIHNLENWHPDQWAWKEDLTAWLRGDQRGLWPDVIYARPGGRDLALDAYLPPGVQPSAAVIVVHGGGWEAGDKRTYVSPLLDVLKRSGLAYFSIDYRLTPFVTNREQIEDLRSAIRYVRTHAQRFHIDIHRISLAGESAGGQLVTQVASLPCPGCEVAGVVSLYGVYDFAQFTAQASDRQMLDRIFGKWTMPALKEASPLNHVSKIMPPVFLIQGTKDELYPGTLAYERALTQAGIEHELVVLDGAPHGMENWVNRPDWLKSLEQAVEWLRRH